MNALLFLIGNLAALGLASVIPNLLIPRREPWRRVLLGFAAYLISIQTTILALGLAGRLTAIAAVGAVAMMAATALGLAARSKGKPAANGEEMTVIPPGKRSGGPLIAVPIFILGGFGGFLGLQLLFGPTAFHWDDLWYHATAMAQWMKDERLLLSPLWFQAYFPLHSEAFALWHMLPWRADAYLSLAGFFWAAFALAAAIALGLAMGRSWLAAMMPAALFAAAPIFTDSARTACAVDLAAPALWLAALAFMAAGPRRATARERILDAAVSGLLAGFAAGTKTSFAIAPPVIFILWIFAGTRGMAARTRAAALMAFFIGACATGGFWYLRTFLIAGNPLFPAEFGPFEGPFTAEAQARTNLLHFLRRLPENLGEILRGHLDWPYGLGMTAGLGLIAGAARMRAQGDRSRDEIQLTLALVVSAVALLVLYPFLPFSGSTFAVILDLNIERRYLILPFAIGLILAGGLAEPGQKHRGALLALAFLAALFSLEGSPGRAAVRLALGCAAVAFAGLCWAGLGTILAARKVQWGAAAAALLALAAMAPIKQRGTDRELFEYFNKARPIGKAWRAAGDLPAGARIAFFGPMALQYYALYGRQFQHEPVRVDSLGRLRKPEHEAWREAGFSWWDEAAPPPKRETLVENLREARIDYLFATRDGRPEWPPQQEILKASESAEAIYDDGHAVIWKLTSPAHSARRPGRQWSSSRNRSESRRSNVQSSEDGSRRVGRDEHFRFLDDSGRERDVRKRGRSSHLVLTCDPKASSLLKGKLVFFE